MDVRRISWGLIVLFVGLVLLFSNLGYINFNWFAVFSLWPVLLIIFGVSFILPDKAESKYIMALITIGVLVLFAHQGLQPRGSNGGWSFNNGIEGEVEEEKSIDRKRGSKEHFSRTLNPETKYATLKIEGGAVSYHIGKSNNDLFKAEASSNIGGFSLLHMEQGRTGVASAEHVTLDFKMQSQKSIKLNKDVQNIAYINLSAVPIWDIELEIGAGKADFDLTDYKMVKLDIDGGVSSINVKMGMPYENEVQVNFDGGLANFELAIPKGAACRIVSDSALSSQRFEGFIKQEDGSFVTENYNASQKKFAVNIDSGLSNFSVRRY